MNDQDYILFEGYISKTLAVEERVDFENRLISDEAFNQAFITYKDLNVFLEQKFENENASIAFKDNLDTISKAYFKTESKTTKGVHFAPWKYAIAASVALLMGYFLFNNFSDPSYNDFSNHDSISLIERGTQVTAVKTAETSFNTKDYIAADIAFDALLQIDSTNAEYQFYKAIANIELDKFEEAEGLLHILKSGQSIFNQKAVWYLALSKLKQKDYEACIVILNTITEEAEDYKQAQKLLKKLD